MSDEILGPGDVCDLLITNQMKQFMAEKRKAEIVAGRDVEDMSDADLIEIGGLGVEIAALNNRRVVLRNALNEMFGQGLIERKIFYTVGGKARKE